MNDDENYIIEGKRKTKRWRFAEPVANQPRRHQRRQKKRSSKEDTGGYKHHAGIGGFKTSHSIRATTASSLFYQDVDE